MMARHSFAETNRTKADFNSIYVQPDPRAYFNVLGGLDYVIPHLAQPVFQQLIAALRRKRRKPLTVLDLGCSYGVNGALMKYGMTLDVLRERFGAPPLQRVSSAELFVSRPQGDAMRTALPQIVSIASGINRRFGQRHRSGAAVVHAPHPMLC
jgi:hypothetical protein